MAEMTLATASQRQVWIATYFMEYVRNSRFAPYMGRSPTSIIVCKYELQKEAGKTINIPLITRLKGDGVTGSGVLDGNEEELGNYNCPISVDWRRNGVRVPKSVSYQTEIDLFNAARDMLKQWEAEKLRDDVIGALTSFVIADAATGGATVLANLATTANKNAFSANNADRLLFGHLISNYSATWATALGNVGTASDICTNTILQLGKRMAKAADPHIRPYTVDDGTGREYFVCFHGARTFRDLKKDTTMTNLGLNARPREGGGFDKNPLAQDGDLIYDGIIHREVPEIDAYCTAVGGFDGQGASAADVRPVFMCGQQTIGIVWGQEPTPRTDTLKDFQFRPGVAIEELLGVKKIAFNSKQFSMVTVIVAAAADS